jgi:hypothetical protein
VCDFGDVVAGLDGAVAVVHHELAWVQERAGRAPADRLVIAQLRIGSPMELSLITQGVGVTAITGYAIYLFAQIVKDPQRVGAWLPRLVAGWHTGMNELDEARRKRLRPARSSGSSLRKHPKASLTAKISPTGRPCVREEPSSHYKNAAWRFEGTTS